MHFKISVKKQGLERSYELQIAWNFIMKNGCAKCFEYKYLGF